jgi:hypothetical protein
MKIVMATVSNQTNFIEIAGTVIRILLGIIFRVLLRNATFKPELVYGNKTMDPSKDTRKVVDEFAP